MTDRLKEFIESNADSFNDLEPSKDSWNKIANRIGHTEKARKRRIRYISIISAACFAGIAMLSLLFVTPPKDTPQLAEVKELNEAEAYYTSQINLKKEQVYQMANNFPDLKEEMDIDLAQLDTIMIQLKNDLKDDVSNNEVIEAMIQNYRMKLSILEEIKVFLDEKNKDSQKTTSYEL
nr:hypothetical protein [uncultured Carboxylicivirga sp.]